jgi:PAS domain S-box-containing protein
MSDETKPTPDDLTESELAHQQALKYGRDLARIYIAEKIKREELEVAYQALSAIFASTPDGLVVLDDAFTIQRANDAFSRLVETPPDAMGGRLISDVLLSDEFLPALQQLAIDEAAPTQFEFTITRPPKRSLLANVARLQAGRLRGWVIVLHDQSRWKRLEHQKAEFINIAAHELRTPLSSILGYSELLQESLSGELDRLGEEPRDYLDAVLRAANRLNATVKELVEFAEINQGDIRPTGIQEFPLPDVIEDVISELQLHAAERNITLRADVPDTAIQMFGDAALLRAALYQLAMNGVNFNTPDGTVSVEAVAGNEYALIKVADSGIGIAQADLDAIYRPFFQVESHDTRRIGGLGLGLSIAQRAVAQLGGTIAVESTLGIGTTFSLQLPLRQPSLDTELAALHDQLDSSYQQSLAYARDIQLLYRQLQQVNRGLSDVNVQLEEANKLKANFLGVVSHELRSPFASIDLALQAFVRHGVENLAPEQRELLKQLTGSFKDARRMIDNLVAYASLLSKQGRLNLETVDIGALVDTTVATLKPMAERRDLTIQVQVPRGLTLPAGDPDRIQEAVWHLLHNAIKFTEPNGQIAIRARAETEILAIEVKDTGIGIPPEKRAKIWEPFSQLSDPLKRGVEGLGIGLALVRYVAIAHGGNVVLHSEPGVGSVVGFWLPLHRDRDVRTAV